MAAASTWTNAAGDGQWLTAANWNGGVPNSNNATADFSTIALVSNLTVNTGNSAPGEMVQTLLLGSTSGGYSYNISNQYYVLNLSTNLAATISQSATSAGDTISGLGIAFGSALSINNNSFANPLTLALPLTGTQTVTLASPGTVTMTATNSNPLGTGSLTLSGGTLQLAPSGSGNAIALFGATNAASTFTYSGGGVLRLNKGSQNSLSYSVGPGSGSVLTRSSPGTLVIMPTAIANLNSTESFMINGTAPSIVNGMVSASIIGRDGTTDGGDFLTYASGFAVAAYDLTNTFTGADNTKKILISSAQTISANTTAYALRNDSTINLNPNVTLTIGNGATQAGLILDNAVIQPASGTATQAFGAAEGMIYASGISSNRTVITGSGGIRTFGPGRLVQGAPLNHTGGTVVESGALQLDGLAVSGNGNLTLGANGKLVVGGSTGVSTVDLQTGTPSYSDKATSYVVGGCPTGVSTVSFGQNCGAVNAILGGPGANENNLAIVKTASAGSTLTLNNNASTFTGGITIAQGALVFQPDTSDTVLGSLGPTNNNITIAAGATLYFAVPGVLASGRTITVNGTYASPSVISMYAGNNSLHTINSKVTGSGWAKFQTANSWGAGQLITSPSSDCSGGVIINPYLQTHSITVSANARLGSGPVWVGPGDQGSGQCFLNLLGNSNLVFGTNAPYTYQSMNCVSGANVTELFRGTAPVMGSLSGPGYVSLGGFNGGNSGGGGAQSQPSAVQLTVGMDGSNATFSGGISESSGTVGSVVKGGSGNWYLTGGSTFSGGLIITNGSLFANQAAMSSVTYTGVLNTAGGRIIGLTSTNGLVRGQYFTSGGYYQNNPGSCPAMISSIDSSTQISTTFPVVGGPAYNTQAVVFAKCGPTGVGQVTVATNTTLGGSGGIWGSVNVNAGGTVAPGADVGLVGTLTVNNNVNFNPGSTLQINISSASSYSQLIVHGTLNLNQTTLNLNFIGGYTLPPGTTLTLLQADSWGSFNVTAPPGYSAFRQGGSVILTQAPSVINNGYTPAGSHSAYLSGTLMSTGNAVTTWGLIFGTNDPGPTLSGWFGGGQRTLSTGNSLPYTVTNLFEQLQTGQTYYFRYWAQNINGLSVADPSTAFTPSLGAPYYMPIRFSGYTNRTETLTNFPALVVLSNNMASGFTLASFLSTNGWDLRFVTNLLSSSYLNYEIESWSTNAGQASAVWVQVPTIPGDGSGVIYVRWGDTSNSNQLPCTTNGATWETNFVGVWHMSQTNAQDSTSNRNNGTSYGNTNAAGVIGSAQGFVSASSQYVDVGNGSSFGGMQAITVSFWFNPKGGGMPLVKAGMNDFYCYDNGSQVSLKLNFAGDGRELYSVSAFPNNVWSMWTGTWNSLGDGYLRVYANGAINATDNTAYTGRTIKQSGHLNLGGTASYYYGGLLDEVRIERVSRSTNWIWACYQNMASNTAFNACGSVTATSVVKDPPLAGTTVFFH